MRYKAGDKVRIKSIDWYNKTLRIPSKLSWIDKQIGFFEGIRCGSRVFTDAMRKFCGKIMTIQEVGITFYLMEEDKIRYEFTDEMIEGLVEEETPKFKVNDIKYPKTYGECHGLMVQWKEYDCNPNSELILCEAPIHDFCKLIVARNIYWKIAGEEMGLEKSWEPDWSKNTEKYVIYPYQYLYSIDAEKYRNTILAFPTREMRDAFYENFKDLIERCKELL